MDITQIRKRNLDNLIRKFGGVGKLAEVVGTDPNYLSQIRSGHRNLGNKLARKIEAATKYASGWMDSDHEPVHILDGNVSSLSAKVTSVPMISWVQAGQWSEAVDIFEPGFAEEWEPTTERVGQNAFALRVEGDSMEPEFPAGGIIIVDPSVEPRTGDYVIAKVKGAATFKQLVWDAGRAFLKPVNPRYQITEMPHGSEIVGVVVSQNKRYR